MRSRRRGAAPPRGYGPAFMPNRDRLHVDEDQDEDQGQDQEQGAEQPEDRADKRWLVLFSCWLLVTGATLGSFFLSEIMDLPPCSLCWYQRIFMFPLPIILLRGLFPFDVQVVRYALPIAAVGWGIALYHTLLQLGVIPETVAPCRQGVSCSSAQLELFGLVSIPMLSLLAFSAVVAALWILRRWSR